MVGNARGECAGRLEERSKMTLFSAPLGSQALISIINSFCSTVNIVNLDFLFVFSFSVLIPKLFQNLSVMVV